MTPYYLPSLIVFNNTKKKSLFNKLIGYIKLFIVIILLSTISCDNKPEVLPCNCQVIGNDHLREVINDNGIQIIHSSLPILITPYDTIVDCSQDQVSWYKITETIEPPKTITKTSYRKIICP